MVVNLALIIAQGGKKVLLLGADLGSTNGTFLNGVTAYPPLESTTTM